MPNAFRYSFGVIWCADGDVLLQRREPLSANKANDLVGAERLVHRKRRL